MTALNRRPSSNEQQRFLKVLNEAKPEELRPVVEDMVWAMLSSKEFLFNH